MSSTDDEPATDETDPDDRRARRRPRGASWRSSPSKLGDSIVASHLVPRRDLFVRVARDDWARTATVARWPRLPLLRLPSAIDWLPSPYGRYEDSVIDGGVGGRRRRIRRRRARLRRRRDPLPAPRPGDRHRPQDRRATSRPTSPTTISGPRPGSACTPAPTGTSARPTRCSASPSTATRTSRASTCPSGFEGYPLRKDFPLLARIVKPWPGIVDVEPMPDEDEADDADAEEDDA